MQIFVKTLTGKTITMEVETEFREDSVDHIIYLNYTSKSHVLTGKPSAALREEMKTRKLATYHPRLYPQGKGGQPAEKGWLIKTDKLDEVKELLKKDGCDPKIVPFKNTITKMFEDIYKLDSAPKEPEPEESNSSSDFDESLVKPVSKEEETKIIEEIKGCLDTPDEPSLDFPSFILPSGIGYGFRNSGGRVWDFYVCTLPKSVGGIIIGHDFVNKNVVLHTGVTYFQIAYGEGRVAPTRAELRTFIQDYCDNSNNLAQFQLHQAMLLFEEKGDPDGVFAKRCPELWNELTTFWTA